MAHNFSLAGLIYGPALHHLDHLAPLCSFLQIPLVVTEEKLYRLGKRYYPNLDIILFDYLAIADYLVSHFDIILYSMPRDLFDEVFFLSQQLLQKRVHAIWCPHGNSDKGESIFYMEALKKEVAALVYGKQMIEFFKRKGVYDQLRGSVITGNFRREYYLENRAFYDQISEEEIVRKLPPADKTLLYAPTWRDYEQSTSFFEAGNPLIETLPQGHNLIIKLHPNLAQQEEFVIEEFIRKYEEKENVLFLLEFTPIYSLLNLVDLYIGDMSSIGYDFLCFNKPMFFLNQNLRDSYLFRCGVEIRPEDYGRIHEKIAHYFQYELRDFSSIRKEVQEYAFGHPKPLKTLKSEILHLCATLPF
jgi:teichoic acid glycerol-phosphate primase